MLHVTLLAILVLPPSSGPRPCTGGPEWTALIEVHLERYPAMGIDDLYKLLHQGVRGSEHAVDSPESARGWMERELAEMGAGPSEPMMDTIAPGGAFVRVHLRPYSEAGGDPEALLQAFVRTANGSRPPAAASAGMGRPAVDDMACAVESAREMARAGRLPWSGASASSRLSELEAEGYPALHHSDAFVSLYRPAYRVISGEMVRTVLPSRSR